MQATVENTDVVALLAEWVCSPKIPAVQKIAGEYLRFLDGDF
jgi:hypothetical protein